MDPQDLFRDDVVLDAFELGAYLGSVCHRDHANSQGLRLFECFSVIPSRDKVISCPRCGLEMRAVCDERRTLGWRYKCANRHASEPSTNTVLEGVRFSTIGVDTIVKLIYMWLGGKSTKKVVRNCRCTNNIVTKWFAQFRDIAGKVACHDYCPIGEAHDIVEIVSHKTNWHHIWIVAGVSRTSKEVFGTLTNRRDRESLFDVMMEHINPESFIITDEWEGYVNCDQYFGGHGTAKPSSSCSSKSSHRTRSKKSTHRAWFPAGRFSLECLDRHFVGPRPSVDVEQPVKFHTETATKTLKSLIQFLKLCQNEKSAKSYVGEWMYRKNILKCAVTMSEKLAKFLNDIARVYPGLGHQAIISDVDSCSCKTCREDCMSC